MSSNIQNIITRDCSYGCNIKIYWNTSENGYFEVFSKKKHICPNRSNNNNVSKSSTYVSKPNYYYNKFSKQSKPKMSNSLELLSGPISEIQKKYEILSDIVTEYQGKVHGSQRDRDPRTGEIDLLIYFEVPEGKREEVKQRFNSIIRNLLVFQK